MSARVSNVHCVCLLIRNRRKENVSRSWRRTSWTPKKTRRWWSFYATCFEKKKLTSYLNKLVFCALQGKDDAEQSKAEEGKAANDEHKANNNTSVKPQASAKDTDSSDSSDVSSDEDGNSKNDSGDSEVAHLSRFGLLQSGYHSQNEPLIDTSWCKIILILFF